MIIPKVIGFIEEIEGMKYLNFAPTRVNKDVLTGYQRVWDLIMERVKKIDGCTSIASKGCFKINVRDIRFQDKKYKINLPLDELIKFNAMAISCRLLIKMGNMYYPQVHLEDSLYTL